MSDTLLSDLEAEDITNHFDSLPPDQQPVARNRLRAYFDEKDRRRAEAFRSVESLMLDAPEDFAKSNPAAVKPLMQPDDWDETRELAGLSTLTGADPRRISKAPGAFRAAVADSWGQPDIATDVPKFRARLKAHFQKSRDTRLLGEDIDTEATRAELIRDAALTPEMITANASDIPSWEKWSFNAPGKPGFDQAQTGAYFAKWAAAQERVRKLTAPLRGQINEAWTTLSGDPNAGEVLGLADVLSQMPTKDRRTVLWAIQQRAEAMPEAQKKQFWDRAGRAFLSSLDQMLTGMATGPERIGDMVFRDFGASPEDRAQLRKRQDTLEELRSLQTSKLQPFESSDDGLLAKVGLGAMQSAPALAAAFAGPVGWYGIGAQMADESRAAVRPALEKALQAQGLDADQADERAGVIAEPLAIAAGAINTAVEKLTFGMATGIPGVRGLQAKLIAATSESLAKRIALRGAAFALEAGEQQLQEAVQDAMPFALADAAKVAGVDLPDFVNEDGSKSRWITEAGRVFGKTALDPTTLGVSLLFAAGGFGHVDGVTLAEGLRREGVESSAIEQVLSAAPEQRAEAAIAAIEAVPPEAKAAAKEAAATQDAAAKAAGVLGVLPTFRVNPDGIGVFLDGQHIGTAPTVDEAMQVAAVASEQFADMDADQTALLASMLETADVFATQEDAGKVAYIEVSPNRRTVAQQLAESAAQGDTQTEARLREEIRLMAEAEGVDPATLSLIAGDNVTTFQNGVAYSVSRVFEGASPLTVVHETAHGTFKAGRRNGVFTRAGTIKVVRGVEQATGQKFFQSTDDTAIGEAELEETVMQLAEAEVLRRRKRGDALAPGAITKGIAAYIRQEARSGAADLKEALSFKHFMSAVRRTMKVVFSRALALRKAQAEGKLGDDYHSFLNKLLGVDTQISHEEAVSQAALDYVPPTAEQEAAGMAFSLANSRAVPADTSRQFVMPDGARLIGPTVFSIKAYHGTPHKVDRFSLDKIGTGEGAQAYGWGLYFAEDRAVGESYKTDLSLTIKVDGNTVLDKNARTRKWTEFGTAEAQAETLLISNRGDIEKAINKAQSSGAFARAVPILEAMRGKVQAETSGNLYTVELLPDESDFLDWDKPLSEQSEKVKAALSELPEWRAASEFQKDRPEQPEQAGIFYFELSKQFSELKAASERLAALGIPGIRYLDGNSRDGGSGTRNFVIFDDKLVKILEENGTPIEPPAQNNEPVPSGQTQDGLEAPSLPGEAAGTGSSASVVEPSVTPEAPTVNSENITRTGISIPPELTNSVAPIQGLKSSDPNILRLEPGLAYRTVSRAEVASLVTEGYHLPDPNLQGRKKKSRGQTTQKMWSRLNEANPEIGYKPGSIVMVARESDIPQQTKGRATPVDAIKIAQFQNGAWQLTTPAEFLKEDAVNSENAPLYWKGDQIELTGRVTPDGFEEFRYVDGAKAGQLGVRMTQKERAATTEERQAQFQREQEDFRRLREIQQEPKAAPSFALAPAGRLASVEDRVQKALDKDPELKRRVFTDIRSKLARLANDWSNLRWTPKGDRIEPIAEKRSAKSLAKEQAFREAARRAELNDLYAGPIEHQFAGIIHQPELAKLGEHPLFQLLRSNLGGGLFKSRIMSATQAAARDINAGRMDQHGDYDGIDGIPRMMFGGTEAPDTVAQEAFEAGLIKDATPDALWDGIRAGLRDVAQARDDLRYALDALKDAQRRARDEAKAEASQWRREADAAQKRDHSPKAAMLRDLVTLDAMLTTLPPEVRAKVGGYVSIARLGTDASRLAELQKRADMIGREMEAHLARELRSELSSLRKKAVPDMKAGQKPKGKIGAEAHRYFNEIARVIGFSEAEIEGERTKLDTMLADDATTPEQAADIFETQQILDTFGGIEYRDAKTKKWLRDSVAVEKALAAAKEVYEEGRNRWRAVEEARLAGVKAMASEIVELLGGPSMAGVQRSKADAAKFKQIAGKSAADLFSFGEVLRFILGDSNPIALRWEDAARNAKNARIDMTNALKRRWRDAIESATGKRGREAKMAVWEMANKQSIEASLQQVSIEKIDIPIEKIGDLAAGKIDAGGAGLTQAEAQQALDAYAAMSADSRKESIQIERRKLAPSESIKLSEAEGIFITMLARQQQYAEALERAGWDKVALDGVAEQLSDAGKSLLNFMADEYRTGYEPLARVFRNMFGVDLPQIQNYAPAAFYHQGDEKVRGPLESVPEGGFRANFLKTRKTHRAIPRLENAFATFLGHSAQSAHWQSHAELVRELRGVFGNPDVKIAMESRFGRDSVALINSRIQSLEGNGISKAHGALDSVANWLLEAQAFVSLAWSALTLLKEVTAAWNSAYEVGLSRWFHSVGRLTVGRAETRLADMWNDPMIQRRIDSGFAPEARAIMDGAFTAKPTKRRAFLERGMELLGTADATFNAVSVAVAYDVAYQDAKTSGLGDNAAHAVATEAADRILDRTAQPADEMNRSLFELRLNAWGKMMFMFASEPRQKTALWMRSMGRLLTGKATSKDIAVFSAHVMTGVFLTTLGAIWKDWRNDDDEWNEELGWLGFIDKDNWNKWDFLRGIALGPISGLPLINEFINPYPSSTPLSRFKKAGEASVQMMEGPSETEMETTEWYADRVTKVLQGTTPTAGVIARDAKILFDMVDNAHDDTIETGVKRLKHQADERKAQRPEPPKGAARARREARVRAAGEN